jgi:hypothetical protein
VLNSLNNISVISCSVISWQSVLLVEVDIGCEVEMSLTLHCLRMKALNVTLH